MKQKFYPVISAILVALIFFSNNLIAQSGLITGAAPVSAEKLLGVRYRNLEIEHENQTSAVFNGIPDLTTNRSNSRSSQDLNYGNSGVFAFTITYNNVANTLVTTTTIGASTNSTTLTNVAGKLIADSKVALANSINLLTLTVKTQNSISSITVSNITIDGMPVTGSYGRTNNAGTSNWYVTSSNLLNGFVVSGTVTMAGAMGNGVEGQLIEFGFANTAAAGATLPVIWGGFTSKRVNTSTNTLQWRTMQEQNTSHYNVQRSVDGIHFQTIGLVLAQGTASAVNDYRFDDKNATGSIYYYRLEQVDLDSKINYSSIIKQGNGGKQTLVAGLGSNAISIQFFTNEKRSIRIVNNSGLILKQFNSNTQQQNLDVNNLSVGVYALQIINSDGTSEVYRFVK